MTAQIIPFRHPCPPNTRLNIGFVAAFGLSIASWAWLIAAIIFFAARE